MSHYPLRLLHYFYKHQSPIREPIFISNITITSNDPPVVPNSKSRFAILGEDAPKQKAGQRSKTTLGDHRLALHPLSSDDNATRHLFRDGGRGPVGNSSRALASTGG
ncbi:hypothetical protein CDAR_525751 [Caerostris darwini]|uniref:Uncharacterized protein n=1 Tax=Caerostris darwini TaxID=1538125 RepID=A0AAV4RTG7_9ARAC|nr:hypothetical protein CDAR_525751 [Caerostris darwini]